VLDLETDEASRRIISAQNPLLLDITTLTGGDTTDLLPIVFDGEDYLLVGDRSSDCASAVAITHLPKPVATTRGAFNTIELFVYRKMGRHTPQLGLWRAEIKDEKAGVTWKSRRG
jgi:hypothetical protein